MRIVSVSALIVLAVLAALPASITFGQSRSSSPTAATYINRGNFWVKKGNYDQAIADYNAALRLDPNNKTAYFNRGITWIVSHRFPLAIDDFNTALLLDPTNRDVRKWLNIALQLHRSAVQGHANMIADIMGDPAQLDKQVRQKVEAMRQAEANRAASAGDRRIIRNSPFNFAVAAPSAVAKSEPSKAMTSPIPPGPILTVPRTQVAPADTIQDVIVVESHGLSPSRTIGSAPVINGALPPIRSTKTNDLVGHYPPGVANREVPQTSAPTH